MGGVQVSKGAADWIGNPQSWYGDAVSMKMLVDASSLDMLVDASSFEVLEDASYLCVE